MRRFQSLNWNSVRVLLLIPVLALSGCGGGVDPGKGVAVSGTVTMDGKPLEGANVTFMNGTFAGYGRTNAEGKYRLVQGALPGNNKVVISKIEGGGEAPVDDPESGMDAGMREAEAMGNPEGEAPRIAKDLVPAEYSDPSKTKLTYEVPAGGTTDVNFDI